MPTNRNINPVAWVDDIRELPNRRRSAYGEIMPSIVPLGVVPPFQVVREDTLPGLVSITLHRVSDGASWDITALMQSTGFIERTYSGYVIWEYPATVALPMETVEGRHYLTIRDGADNFLYREIFSWRLEAALSGFVKLEWFNLQPLPLPFGQVVFNAPFKFWHYFQTELGKPSYEVERVVEPRDGYEFRVKVTSWKEHRFVTIGDEFLTDALSFLPHMDCINCYFLGNVFPVNRIVVSPQWIEGRHLARVEIELRSNTIVTTDGEATEPKDYSVPAGGCLNVSFTAVAVLEEGGAEYVGKYYVLNGQNVALQAGDYVLVKSSTDGKNRLHVFGGTSYSVELVPAAREACYSVRENEYFFYTAFYKFSKPVISNLNASPWSIEGFSFENSLVEVWGKNLAGEEELLAIGTNTEFESGIEFEGGDNVGFQVRATTYLCNDFARSDWRGISGIGVMVVGSTFIVAPNSQSPQPQSPTDG